MARVNVWIPDDLREAAKKAGLNVSQITQEAIKTALAAIPKKAAGAKKAPRAVKSLRRV